MPAGWDFASARISPAPGTLRPISSSRWGSLATIVPSSNISMTCVALVVTTDLKKLAKTEICTSAATTPIFCSPRNSGRLSMIDQVPVSGLRAGTPI